MSHEIDTTNGVSSFVSAREDAWHRLGTTMPMEFTAEEAMNYGNLGNWNVRKEKLNASLEDFAEIPVPNHFATVRDNPVSGLPEVLGVVGKRYEVMQNEELCGLLESLVDQSGAIYETAGAVKGGRRVFITMKLPEHINIGGEDPVDQYLAAVTSHDGSMPTTLMVTPVRVVCQNTLNLAFGRARNTLKIRHTSSSSQLLTAQARQALDFSFKYLGTFQEEAERLLDEEFTRNQFSKIVDRAFAAPEDASDAAETRAMDRMGTVMSIYDSATQDGIRETKWGALNAITEYYDHFQTVRPTEGSSDEARALKSIFDPGRKDEALQLVNMA